MTGRPLRIEGGSRELPQGSVPCRRCGLPIGAGDPYVGNWSATGGVLTHAAHSRDDYCIRALGLRVVALEATVFGQQGASDA